MSVSSGQQGFAAGTKYSVAGAKIAVLASHHRSQLHWIIRREVLETAAPPAGRHCVYNSTAGGLLLDRAPAAAAYAHHRFRTVMGLMRLFAHDGSRLESLDPTRVHMIRLRCPFGDIAEPSALTATAPPRVRAELETSLGLEFIALSKESSDTLDKLLVKLGGKPRDAKLEEMVVKAASSDGMSAWRKQVQKDDDVSESRSDKSSETTDE